MDKFLIRGKNPLQGKVSISGAKNAAVAIIPACLLAEEDVFIENLPQINDVKVYAQILKYLGAGLEYSSEEGTLNVTPCKELVNQPSYDDVKRLRASYYLLGVLLAKFGEAKISLPGGCDIGVRPIDQHIKGFEALGAEIELNHGVVHAKAKKLIGTTIYLDVISVGATINIMLAATKAEGVTIIENAAKEPHIVDVANFLNVMGAEVKGAGTDVIKIKGVPKMKGCSHMIIPDQVEAGTYMIASALNSGSDVLVENVIPKHMDPITAKLLEAGVQVTEYDDSIRVKPNGKLKNINVKTLPYPGFPTDLQQPITPLLTVAKGTSIVTETVWDSRFKHIAELKRMGANIKVEGRTAIIEGIDSLSGAPIKATDLRGGAAMIVAGLSAEGDTEISSIEHIDRGYEKIEHKLKSINADIQRIKTNQ